jgi:5'-3' exonuclease
MGVPGLFAYLWKKYKKTNFVFTKSKIPESDVDIINNIECLLIDMNCMIHPICFETLRELDPTKKIDQARLENKMIANIIIYLEKMIANVQPTKCVYIAIDGVCPVSKMCQQRLRRNKHISDTEVFNNIRKKYNKPIPYYWCNSSITPGTLFMQKITNKLIEWASKSKIEIIFSSATVAGEGEHKILQYIRNNTTYTRYVIYGLDADLIFLMLATQSDTVYLMREANAMDSKEKDKNIINFVSIKTMKQCIMDSITQLIDKDMHILLNKNRIIDDFIFICCLLGNDFIPHLPSLDIYDSAIDDILRIYIDTVIHDDIKYMVDRNNPHYIDNDIFYKFLVKLASGEEQTLILLYNKKQYHHQCLSQEPFDIEMHRIENMMFKVKDDVKLGSDTHMLWRERYYKHYYNTQPDENDEFSAKMTHHYMLGLKWIIMYYLDKCPSWDWYYPYLNGPLLIDMVRNPDVIKNVFTKMVFILSKPLSPFEQLLTVLPKESSYLLPKELRKIMTNIHGSASHLYPTKFELDMIGKKKYWMCNPILPNLEINLIKKMFEKYSKLLPSDMRELNKTGEIITFNSV